MFHLFIFQLFDFLVKCLIAIAQILCSLVCKQNSLKFSPDSLPSPSSRSGIYLCHSLFTVFSAVVQCCVPAVVCQVVFLKSFRFPYLIHLCLIAILFHFFPSLFSVYYSSPLCVIHLRCIYCISAVAAFYHLV